MRIAVVGGGVTGAVAARALSGWAHEVVLYEAGHEIGGLAGSHQVGGTPLECFYHHIFNHESHIRGLIDELGLTERLEWIRSSVGIFDRNGRMWPFTTPQDLLRFGPLPPAARVRMGAAAVLSPRLSDWRRLDDVTAVDWIRRTMGAKALEEVWGPMLEVKFGEVYEQVPAAWLWARLSQRSLSRDSKSMGESLGYMRGGFKTLYDALADDLVARGVKVNLSTPVKRISAAGHRVRGVETEAGFEEFDQVLSTLPIPVFSRITEGLPPAYASRVQAVEYMGVICIVLTLDREVQPIYWVNVADREIPFGAYIEHTNLVPAGDYAGNHVVYLGRYFPPGHYSPECARFATGDLQEIGREWTGHIRNINPDFDDSWVRSTTPFRTPFAAPLVSVGYGRRRLPFATPVDGLWLATMAQIYPQDRGMSDGVRIGLEVARAMGRG